MVESFLNGDGNRSSDEHGLAVGLLGVLLLFPLELLLLLCSIDEDNVVDFLCVSFGDGDMLWLCLRCPPLAE